MNIHKNARLAFGQNRRCPPAGRGNFLLTYVNLTFDKFSTGVPTGTSKVRQTATIDKTGNSYSGSGDLNYFDTDGSPVFGGTFTVTATRIRVEAPPGQ